MAEEKRNESKSTDNPDGQLSLTSAVRIVAAYVGNNSVATSTLPELIKDVHGALAELGKAAVPVAESLVPAVPVRRSVTPDHIVCLEDGLTFRSLKRHLQTEHGLTPQQYRERWGLRPDYPTVAPNYSIARSEMAKAIGLGKKKRNVRAKPLRSSRRKAAAE